jgi:hypothetical protein
MTFLDGTGNFSTLATSSSILNLTGALTPTVMYTAPANGFYAIFFNAHVVTTNNVGTVTVTYTIPGFTTANTSFTVPVSGGPDFVGAVRSLYMSAGTTITASSVAAGLTGTTYNIYLSVIRLQ